MSLHTNRWHMAYFLCNFQGFPLLWAASAISFLSMGFAAIFSVFRCFGRLLPKMLKKLYFPGFLRILSMSLIKADGTWFIFPANFIFSFALDGFCQTAEKVAVSILCNFLVLTLRWGAPSGTTAEKVAISMLFPLQESLTFMISLR